MRKFSSKSLLNRAQGDVKNTLEKEVADRSIDASNSSIEGVFQVVIVEEVISNPRKYFNKPWPEKDRTYNGAPIILGDVLSGKVKIDDDGKAIKSPWDIDEPVLASLMPPNSIKGFKKSTKNSGSASKSVLCFPFFSSHFSMPVKPGEEVWVIKLENIHYWMSRKSSYLEVEDLNYTFSPREINVRKVKTSEDPFTYTHFEGNTARGKSIDMQNIINRSVAYKEEFTGEPVFRQIKECGDFLIQGSNNSHIYLGKEKFEKGIDVSSTVSPNVFTTSATEEGTLVERKPVSPAIDICVLRKKSEILELSNKIPDSNSLNEPVEAFDLSATAARRNDPRLRYYENEKSRRQLGKEESIEEFVDSRIDNSLARIYLSNTMHIDSILGIQDIEIEEEETSASPQGLISSLDYGTAAILSTNTRIVGNETLKIHNKMGMSGIQFTPEGDVIIFSNIEGGAKIILESGGDIRIVPGENGVLKLGSDEPDGVPMGGTKFESSSVTAGSVAYTPATTTSGGLVADPSDLDRANPSAGLPKYSLKVLFS